MKHLYTILACILMTQGVQAQSVGIGTMTPDPSAKLEVASDTSGVLVPRMTAAQRDAITDPATGLLVYVTTDNTFYYYDGTMWTTFDSHTRGLVDADGDTKVEVEQTPDDDIIRFMSRDSQIMIIDSTGNIGIGDTMPAEALSLKGGNFLQTPGNPVLTGNLGIGSEPKCVYVSGRYAYVVDAGSDDLKVIDVSDPAAPALMGSLAIGSSPQSVYVSGRYAYVVDAESNDLKVIDVSNPAAPAQVGSLGIGSYSYSV
jgi:YVTN family beta-propeller protein